MALRFSTALRNKIASGMSWAEALQNGELIVFTGTQPANADTASSGTELIRFTLDGGNYTAPTQCITQVALGVGSGNMTALTVGGSNSSTGFNLLAANGVVAANLTDGAANCAAQVNAKVNPFGITASSNGSNLLLNIPESAGADLDTTTCYAAVDGTLTATINGGDNILGGANASQQGVASANGLNFKPAANGVLSKETTDWKANATANGTAGWFRYVAGGSASNVTGTSELCFDGSIATSGGDMTFGTLTINANAPQVISTFNITVPAS